LGFRSDAPANAGGDCHPLLSPFLAISIQKNTGWAHDDEVLKLGKTLAIFKSAKSHAAAEIAHVGGTGPIRKELALPG
jgi:hypothetical protein